MSTAPFILLQVFAFLWAASLGSFLNVVIYRLPLGMSLSRPGSRCSSCLTPIRWFDNVPVVSWLLLRGRCRACGETISIQYPLVEFATGLFGLLARGGQLQAAVFLPELGQLALEVRYLRGRPGDVDAPFGQVQQVGALLAATILLQRIEGGLGAGDFGSRIGAELGIGFELGQAPRQALVVDIEAGRRGWTGNQQGRHQGKDDQAQADHGAPPSAGSPEPITREISALSCFSVSTDSRSLPSLALIAASSLLTEDSSARLAASV